MVREGDGERSLRREECSEGRLGLGERRERGGEWRERGGERRERGEERRERGEGDRLLERGLSLERRRGDSGCRLTAAAEGSPLP